MNELDRKIERYLETMVEQSRQRLRHAEEILETFRKHHGHHHHPHHLASVGIGFSKQSTKGSSLMANATGPGPLSLSTVGQKATARLFYFDTNGNPMPEGYAPPKPGVFSIDDKEAKVVKVIDNGDGTATIEDVADGTANLSVEVVNEKGDTISASQVITVANGGGGEPGPVLGSVGIGFDV